MDHAIRLPQSPHFDGKRPERRRNYCATEVYTHFGHNASISMELLTAYPIPRPEDAGAAPFTYRRSVTLDKKEGKVVVKDTTNLPDVILNFITYEKPVVSEGRLQIGSLASAAFTGAAPLTRPKDFPAHNPGFFPCRGGPARHG